MRISDWSSDVCSSDLSAGTEAASYTELLHVRRRFIHKEALRSATALVTNAVLATRDQRIWGEAGTACASDSTKVGAWDQNLMAERSEEHTSELQSLMRISYAVFCLKKKMIYTYYFHIKILYFF